MDNLPSIKYNIYDSTQIIVYITHIEHENIIGKNNTKQDSAKFITIVYFPK